MKQTGGVQLLMPPRTPEQEVYVNSSLRFDSIDAIGFDMDYTLAVYHHPTIDEAAFRFALDSLVEAGYPEVIRNLRYRPERTIRGLVVDKARGNVLKMDRFHYVSVAWHGSRELTADEKRALYANRRIPLGSRRFTAVDTLFALPDVDLFLQLVAWKDELSPELKGRSYETIWNDVRSAVDSCHRDGRLKRAILGGLDRFVALDPELPQALETLRRRGKKLFLLTNSEFYFTDKVMAYLLAGKRPDLPHWVDYFDDVVVQAGKPRYFVESPTAKVVAELSLTEGGKRTVFEGGNYRELHARLGFGGDRILFVGDHIYGDVIRSKQRSFWRTLMIVPELDRELTSVERARGEVGGYLELLRELDRADRQVSELRSELDQVEGRNRELETRFRTALESSRSLQEIIRSREQEIDRSFHPQWGALFHDGAEISHFGGQVQTYADLYSSRVSNLARYPENKYFHAPWQLMAHLRGG